MDRIKLRALTRSDITSTLHWHNNEDIKNLYSGHPFPVNIEMEEKWYEKLLTSNFPTTVFGIEIIDTNELIGILSLKNINLINRDAELAIYIGADNAKGKGFSKEATLLILNFAFNNLGLNRIYLKVLETNHIANKLYKKCGFIEEGKFRESVFKKGKFCNEIIMSILKNDYLIRNGL